MKRILIINSSYYKQISKKLVLGAKKVLSNRKYNTSILDVPGIYEIPRKLSNDSILYLPLKRLSFFNRIK